MWWHTPRDSRSWGRVSLALQEFVTSLGKEWDYVLRATAMTNYTLKQPFYYRTFPKVRIAKSTIAIKLATLSYQCLHSLVLNGCVAQASPCWTLWVTIRARGSLHSVPPLHSTLFPTSHLSGGFETGTCYVALAVVKVSILLPLPQSVESRDDAYATTQVVLFFLCHHGPFLSFYKIPSDTELVKHLEFAEAWVGWVGSSSLVLASHSLPLLSA